MVYEGGMIGWVMEGARVVKAAAEDTGRKW